MLQGRLASVLAGVIWAQNDEIGHFDTKISCITSTKSYNVVAISDNDKGDLNILGGENSLLDNTTIHRYSKSIKF